MSCLAGSVEKFSQYFAGAVIQNPHPTLRIMPDYQCGVPLWGPVSSCIDLDAALVARLRLWQESFDENFHWDSGWKSQDSKARWSQEAEDIIVALKVALPPGVELEVDLWPLHEE